MMLARDGYDIAAESPGRSMLLLPLQYSHCLTIVGDVGPRVVRANVLQTLLVFEGSIKIGLRNRLGLFGQAGCGLQDAGDAAALQ
jgi:hypothetical protein